MQLGKKIRELEVVPEPIEVEQPIEVPTRREGEPVREVITQPEQEPAEVE